tara:strand:- start:70 stop:369 length:300 start_codon:yes stop_codon:yes gene_type:complete
MDNKISTINKNIKLLDNDDVNFNNKLKLYSQTQELIKESLVLVDNLTSKLSKKVKSSKLNREDCVIEIEELLQDTDTEMTLEEEIIRYLKLKKLLQAFK